MSYFVEELTREYLERRELRHHEVDFALIHLAVDISHDDARRGDEFGSIFILLAIAHLEQYRYQFVHLAIEFFLRLGIGKEVERLHSDRVHGVRSEAHALVAEEEFQAAEVVGKQGIDAHIHLHEVETRSHFEECSDASIEVLGSLIAVAVGNEFGELVVKANFVLQRHGHRRFRREHEANESRQLSVFINQVAQFVAHHEAKFFGSHQVEKSRVDVDDMRLVLTLSSHRKCIDTGVAGDVEIDGLGKTEFIFHLSAESIEIGQEFLFHLEAMTFHIAAPIGIAVRRGAEFAQHRLHNIALQGVVYLCAFLAFQIDRHIEFVHSFSFFCVGVDKPIPKTSHICFSCFFKG